MKPKRDYSSRTIPPAPSPQRRFDHAKGNRKAIVLDPSHPAAAEARTLFPSTVRFVEETGRILKSGHNQRKLGRIVTKGPWRGFPIYALTLQERATCPASCSHWASCYGNHMHLAERIHHDADFEEVLWIELQGLARLHPAGFVVRLHVLGDFYSVDYVKLWARAIGEIDALRVFGYTARDPRHDPIGRALMALSEACWDRFAMRFSGRHQPHLGAVTIDKGASTPFIVCPAQTGRTECCATCMLCPGTTRTIAFERHGAPALPKAA